MSRKFGTHLDLQKNELQNARVQNLAAAPGSPVTGQLYYDTGTTTLYWFDGTDWVAAKAGAGTPTGAAGGSLAGTYPNPSIASGAIGTNEIAAAIKDPVAGTAGLRTLGTGAQQAAAGNDSRFTNARTPTGAAGGDLAGTYPNPTLSTAKDAEVKSRANHTGTQAASTISDLATVVKAYKLNEFAAPVAAVPMGSQKITGLGAPTADTDAATKLYVDSTAQGLDVKPSVRVATTANIALTGTQTIDGVAVVANDRVLVKNQTAPAENGIYIVAAGAWARGPGFNTSAEASPGSFVFVEEGTSQADTGWVATHNAPVTLGTTAIPWAQFSGAGAYTAGAGMTQTGTTFNVVGTANRVTANADSIDIASTYVGQTSITTLGTVTTGLWEATDVAVIHGGTGASTAAAARTNLGATGKYAVTLTGGAASEVVTHNLNTQDAQVVVREVAAPYAQVELDVEFTGVNTVTVRSTSAIPAATYRVVVIG